jgi:hypothetical protein
MNSLEHLVELIESHSPSYITILAPVFNPTFLWRLSKDVGLYKRKNLCEIKVFVLNFTNAADATFFLKESIELQELFPKIKIFKIDINTVNEIIKIAPGVILMTNGKHKAYTFETEFSSAGFDVSGVLSVIPVSRAKDYFEGLHTNSIKISRDAIDLLASSELQAPIVLKENSFFYGNPVFDLTFVSSKTKKIHNAGAGLNWGQHTSSRRRKDLNAAYIHVPKSIQGNPALPEPGHIFRCKFIDGIEFDMVRTGEGGKNLTSAYENQILGRYLRNKFKLVPGNLISNYVLDILDIYGVSFIKVYDKSYLAKFNNLKESKVYDL